MQCQVYYFPYYCI